MSYDNTLDPALTPEQVAAIMNPCPLMFTDRGEVDCTTSPTFTPIDFFEHIKHGSISCRLRRKVET